MSLLSVIKTGGRGGGGGVGGGGMCLEITITSLRKGVPLECAKPTHLFIYLLLLLLIIIIIIIDNKK